MATESSGAIENSSPLPSRSTLLTFLIADVRGYTRFTFEQGDAAAARLASRFAEITEEVVTANAGSVIELRGDEALCIFPSARSALNCALALQVNFGRAVEVDPSLPIQVGIGLDAGEAVQVKGGYRGAALNLAARLCSIAGPGEIFCTETVSALSRRTEGIAFVDRGAVTLKGLPAPVRVIQIAPEGQLPSDLSPLQSILVTHPTNLPDEPTPFIGREEQIDQLATLLQQPKVRLVTLTGPGGTGKTRLALQVANTLLHSFRDGAFFVSLAPVLDPSLVPSALAEALGVNEKPGREILDELVKHLEHKHLLLVLDNFEHLLDASSGISSLLDSCREVYALVTSRTPLHVSWEHEYSVPPLSVPDPDQLSDLDTLSRCEAVALFVDRARAVKADFTLTDENAPAVAGICVRLDGLPLAVELAAARVKLLPPQALLRRLSSRLELLTGGGRDRPGRQQTLRNAIDWSYSLLSDEEQTLLARLSVFVGGCTLEDAETVCAPEGELDVLETIASLVDKSLVRQEGDDEPRFSMLETIREYAGEKLAEGNETEVLRRRHAEHYGALVMSAEPDIKGEREPAWFERFDRDRENIRAAIEWHRAHRPETALLLGHVLHQYWIMRADMRERLRWIEDVCAYNALLPADQRVKVLDLAAHLAGNLMHPRAEELFERCVALREELGDIAAEWDALEQSAHRLLREGQTDEALRLFEESLALQRVHGKTETLHYEEDTLLWAMQAAQMVGDYSKAGSHAQEALTRARGRRNAHDIARWQAFLGWLALLQGDHAQAADLLEQSLDVQRALADKNCMSASLLSLAILALEHRKPREAEQLAQESLVYVRELQQTGREAEHLDVLGRAAIMVEELERAGKHYQTGLELAEHVANKRAAAEAIWGLAALAVAQQDWQRAIELGGLASTLQEEAGYHAAPIEQSWHEQTLASARSHLDHGALDAAWKRGRASSLDEATLADRPRRS
jgi:predicted ATPase/class 3 adenylate cyclase